MIEKQTAGTTAVQKEKLERAWDRNLNLRDVLETVAEERYRLRAQNAYLLAALVQSIESAGFHVCGPTDSRVAEHGEPAWVCNARLAIARATGSAS